MLINLTNKKGFSLIELMVTITILSIIILGLVTFFTGGTRSWISGQSQIKAQRETRQVMDQMVREIREANLIDTSSNSGSLSFITPFDSGEIITYSYNSIDKILSRKKGSGPNTPLINNVLNFNVIYLDNEDNTKNPASENSQISKIRISLLTDMDNDTNADITLESDVDLRNYGL